MNESSTLQTASKDNLILGAYFAGKPHPQHGWSVPARSFDYFADWFHSILRLGLRATLLHDHLPESFIAKFAGWFKEIGGEDNGGRFGFERVELGEFTAGDERFFHFREYLARSRAKNVFIVDVSDAWFNRDPFRLLERRTLWEYFDSTGLRNALGRAFGLERDPFIAPDGLGGWLRSQLTAWRSRAEFRLFFGGEDTLIGENPWMLKHYEKVYGGQFPDLMDKPVLNCGVIGGGREDVLELLNLVCAEMESLKVHAVLNDMAVFNRIAHQRFDGLVYSGGVLNSPWKRWRKRGNHAIFHK